MAKFETGDDIGKPGKPPKVRPFPWRLWMFALLMTGAAGAGGYFTWHFYNAEKDARVAKDKCFDSQKGLQTSVDDFRKTATECAAARDKQTAEMRASADGLKALEAQNQQLSTNLNASKEELAALRIQRAEAEKRLAAIEEIQKQFAKMIDTGDLKVTSRRGALVLELPAEVLFPSGVADLSEKGRVKVLEVGFALKKFPDRRFLVVGHSDNQPLKGSNFKDNWELSAARALNVTRILVEAGMKSTNLVPAGAGEHDPIAPNNSAKNMAQNRRIEIALLPAINELPPLPKSITDGDGKQAKK